ncbi:hypothetical protein GCM10010279_69440 [Streptomyces mutabilis]|nr:hypothetical protein GCM10010279_69440 [Streptomyces mutabilis]
MVRLEPHLAELGLRGDTTTSFTCLLRDRPDPGFGWAAATGWSDEEESGKQEGVTAEDADLPGLGARLGP